MNDCKFKTEQHTAQLLSSSSAITAAATTAEEYFRIVFHSFSTVVECVRSSSS